MTTAWGLTDQPSFKFSLSRHWKHLIRLQWKAQKLDFHCCSKQSIRTAFMWTWNWMLSLNTAVVDNHAHCLNSSVACWPRRNHAAYTCLCCRLVDRVSIFTLCHHLSCLFIETWCSTAMVVSLTTTSICKQIGYQSINGKPSVNKPDI